MALFANPFRRQAALHSMQATDQRLTTFAAAETDLLAEFVSTFDDWILISSDVAKIDLGVLREALARMLICIQQPGKSFPHALRAETMDVLRSQHQDENGLDPVAVIRAGRALAFGVGRAGGPPASSRGGQDMAALLAQRDALLTQVNALQARCAGLEELLALVQAPVVDDSSITKGKKS